jgi:hypothetical protein
MRHRKRHNRAATKNKNTMRKTRHVQTRVLRSASIPPTDSSFRHRGKGPSPLAEKESLLSSPPEQPRRLLWRSTSCHNHYATERRAASAAGTSERLHWRRKRAGAPVTPDRAASRALLHGELRVPRRPLPPHARLTCFASASCASSSISLGFFFSAASAGAGAELAAAASSAVMVPRCSRAKHASAHAPIRAVRKK